MLAASNHAIVSTLAVEEFAYRLAPGDRRLQARDPARAGPLSPAIWAAFDAFVPGTPLFG
jgi:lysophospholipase